MSETQIPRAQRQLTARSAIWLTCPDCGDAARVLAVMISRVLQQRQACPNCLSAHAPKLALTPSGAHIPASEAQRAESNDDEEARLYAWIEHDRNRSRLYHWFTVVLNGLATRFSSTRRPGVQQPAVEVSDERALELSHSENDLP